MAGHAGDAVVQHDDGRVAVVIGDVNEAGDAGMDEGGVADDGHALGFIFRVGLIPSMERGDGSAHADAGVNHAQGSGRAQGVAADVSADGDLQLFQGIEQSPVGAAGAKHRRTGRDRHIQADGGVFFSQNHLADQPLGVFALKGEGFLTDDFHADGLAVFFQEGIQLFQHVHLIAVMGEALDQLFRQGVNTAQFQVVHLVPQGFLGVLVADAGADHADLGTVVLHRIDVGGFRPVLLRFHPVFHNDVALFGLAGHHHVFVGVLHIGMQSHLFPVTQFHQAPGVGHPGGEPQHHRGVKLLGQGESQFGIVLTFLGVGGLQHHQFGRLGVVAGILFVLGRVHSRVVRHQNHHAGVDAGVGGGEQGVGGHIEAHVLHAGEGPRPGDGGAQSCLHPYLFIGGPFTVDLRIGSGRLGDFGAGSAGIAGHHTASGFVQAPGNGLVADEKLFFHVFFSLFIYDLQNLGDLGLCPKNAVFLRLFLSYTKIGEISRVAVPPPLSGTGWIGKIRKKSEKKPVFFGKINKFHW